MEPQAPIIKPPTKVQILATYILNNITIISVGFFIILAIGIVAFFYNQNQKLKTMLAKYVESSPTPIVNNDPLASWAPYENAMDNYNLKIPREWNKTKDSSESAHLVVFQSGDGLYRFTINAELNKNKVTGKAYASIDEFIGLPYAVKALQVSAQEARQPMPRSGFENFDKVYFFSQDQELIYSLELLVGDGTKTDHRVTFESLQIGSDIFDKILGTFKFRGTTACTMEAKICPDGSSVGRSGPNCDFAPCPTPK